VSRSSWRTCPKVNERRRVPQVEGAMTRWPQHLAGSAAAQQVGVVDAVPTRQHRVDQGQQLAAGPVRASQLARSISASAACSMPSRPARVAASSRPQLATAGGVVEAAVELVQGVGGSH
jgi:hypothetical protein